MIVGVDVLIETTPGRKAFTCMAIECECSSVPSRGRELGITMRGYSLCGIYSYLVINYNVPV